MTCQVPEEKKSWTPPNVLAITGGFFRSSIQRETRARRSPRGRRSRTRRRSACRQRSPSYALILGEIGEEVKGPGDEHRPAGGPGPDERLGRRLDCLDLGEVARGSFGQVGGRQRPRAARARGDEAVAQGREGRKHAVHVLVGEDRRDDGVVRARQAREDVTYPAEVVGAVPDLERFVVDSLEPAGQLDVDVAV